MVYILKLSTYHHSCYHHPLWCHFLCRVNYWWEMIAGGCKDKMEPGMTICPREWSTTTTTTTTTTRLALSLFSARIAIFIICNCMQHLQQMSRTKCRTRLSIQLDRRMRKDIIVKHEPVSIGHLYENKLLSHKPCSLLSSSLPQFYPLCFLLIIIILEWSSQTIL